MSDKIRFFGETRPKKSKSHEDQGYLDVVPEQSHDAQIYKTRHGSQLNGKMSYGMQHLDNSPQSEAELINEYRNVAEHPTVDMAIDEIVNEMFVTDGESNPITINLENLPPQFKKLKTLMEEEFEYILRLMNFNRDAFEIFKKFYIDSRLHYYKVVDTEKPSEGIQELRYIDPISLRKIRQVEVKDAKINGGNVEQVVDQREFYVFTPKESAYGATNGGFGGVDKSALAHLNSSTASNPIILSAYSVATANSGLYDHTRGCIKGYLQKVMKPLNDLVNLETHMIIYRIARAPERRVFYIDTGGLPPKQAQQYLNFVQDSYRREVHYDSSTGQIQSDSKSISMHEDFWLPRSADGKSTQVDTLNGAQNLSQIEDIEYLNVRFQQSLNVPLSRFDKENSALMILGGSSENNRDEIKFQKFVSRLRSRFNTIFKDLLSTQMVLKASITLEEWDEIENAISFDYVRDSYIEDQRQYAILRAKMEVAVEADDLVDRGYYSKAFVMKNILKLSDEEIQEIQTQRAEELANAPKEDF